MNKKLIIILLFPLIVLFFFVPLHAQWAKTYGGSDNDHVLSINQTTDGGYIAAGFAESFGSGGYDAWILKLSSNGDIEWQKTYGGSGYDRFNCIQQTSDGGYVVAGESDSFGDWIIKLSSTGDIEWQKTYGSNKFNYIQQTSDGGYIVASEIHIPGEGRLNDFWILKLTSIGDVEWELAWGGSGEEYTFSIRQASDGGYVVAGGTTSSGAGGYDAWIIKLSSTGVAEWSRTYGGVGSDFPRYIFGNFPRTHSFQKTSDGGYIVAGSTDSFGTGGYDAWILKLSSNGDIEWQRTYGGSNDDFAYSIHQTSDGGYVFAGETDSFGEFNDIWILKLSSTGDIEWQKTYGGNKVLSIQETSDGGYIAAGQGVPFVTPEGEDFFILKLDSDGDIPPDCWLEGSSDASVVNTSVSTVILFFGTLTGTGVSPSTTNCSIQDTDATVTMICPGYVLSITSIGGGTTDPASGSSLHPYGIGEEVQIEAFPEPDYWFKEWTGDVPGGHENDNPVTITMDSDKHLWACFSNLYMLTIAAGPGGTTNPQPGDYEYEIRKEVSVEALAHDGYRFSSWSGNASGTTNPITITVDSDKSITANFSEIEQENSDGDKEPCFIATAAYGSSLHPHVKTLRDFRDKCLMPTKTGRAFVSLYCKYSPFFAELITKYKILKVVVRIQLLPLVALSYSIVYTGLVPTALILLFILTLPIIYVLFYRRN